MHLKPPPYDKYQVVMSIMAGLTVAYFIFGAVEVLYVSTAIGVLALAWGRLAHYIATAWMYTGAFLGFVNSRILLTIIFYLLLTPIALIHRISGKSKIRLKKPATTNWKQRVYTFSKGDMSKSF